MLLFCNKDSNIHRWRKNRIRIIWWTVKFQGRTTNPKTGQRLPSWYVVGWLGCSSSQFLLVIHIACPIYILWYIDDWWMTCLSLLGNIRDILGTAMKNKNEFRARQSAINSYMNKYKVVRFFLFAPTIESLICPRCPNLFRTESSYGWSSLGSRRKIWTNKSYYHFYQERWKLTSLWG